jgi:hypothetical protein
MGGIQTPTVTYKKPEYSPVSQAGLDDTLDPLVESGKQLYKKFTASGKNPIPLNLKALGAGTAAGIVAESATQNILDDLNKGRTDNPYIANLQRLGSRMVGGATSGGIYSGNPAGAIVGAIGGAATDIGENVIDAAKLTPKVIQLIKDKMETNRIEKELSKKNKTQSKLIPIRKVVKQT